jgi:hypothetical protein
LDLPLGIKTTRKELALPIKPGNVPTFAPETLPVANSRSKDENEEYARRATPISTGPAPSIIESTGSLVTGACGNEIESAQLCSPSSRCYLVGKSLQNSST